MHLGLAGRDIAEFRSAGRDCGDPDTSELRARARGERALALAARTGRQSGGLSAQRLSAIAVRKAWSNSFFRIVPHVVAARNHHARQGARSAIATSYAAIDQ